MKAIAERVPSAAVEEAHFFQPIRQGGVESGVAVIAAREAMPAASAAAENVPGAPATGHARLAVYTAQYRLTLKGPDRGKWEFSIQAEADAPLLTVDAVVRGVQRRSGDAEDPVRLSGDDVRDVVPPPPPAVAEAALPPSEAAGTMG